MEVDEGVAMQLVSRVFDIWRGCKRAVYSTHNHNQGVEPVMNWCWRCRYVFVCVCVCVCVCMCVLCVCVCV